jgi:ribosomal protein S1
VKNLQGDELLWGDEIEYGVFKLDHKQKKVRLSLRAKEVINLGRAGSFIIHESLKREGGYRS